MPNNFVTAKLIAQRALPLLKDKISFLPLVSRGYDDTFRKEGDTIQVIKPSRTSTVDGSADISGSFNDINESAVEITLDTQRAVPFVVTSKEKTLNVDSFQRQVIEPAVVALAEYVNSALAGLYKDVPYYYGASGTTPSTLSDLTGVRRILQENRVPQANRALVLDFAAESSFLNLDKLVEVDKSGVNSALRDAALGRVMGMTLFSDAGIKTHTAGTFTAVGTPLVNGTIAAGSSTIAMDGGAGTETILKGDIMEIDGYQYVATADAVAAAGAISVSVYPAVQATIADDTPVTFPDKTAGAHVANLAFHKSAFCFATAPLAPTSGAESFTVSYDGLSIRVVRDYDINVDKEKWRMDILFGVKTIYPELAARLLG